MELGGGGKWLVWRSVVGVVVVKVAIMVVVEIKE